MSNAGYGNHDGASPAPATPAQDPPRPASPPPQGRVDAASDTPKSGTDATSPQGDEVDPGVG